MFARGLREKIHVRLEYNTVMNHDEDIKGVIFNIQTYSIHDGPGIRTTVFVMGCPLRCAWCQNPESQSYTPQLFYDSEKCTGCGNCVEVCPLDAIDIYGERSRTNREICKGTGNCAEVCPVEARNPIGSYVSVGEVFRKVMEDKVFYEKSGGGVTLGGGEPLASPDFSIGLLRLCKSVGIHTTLDTCGYASWGVMRRVLDYVDLVLYDLKHMDPVAHKAYTGVSNELILENIARIHRELALPALVRIPLIPGYNDSLENLQTTARFVATELGSSAKVHLLPFHRLGETKYQRLERPSSPVSINPPSEEDMRLHSEIFSSFGLNVQVGG